MDISDVAAIEYPTLKVPYEILNKKFRSAQKVIDREVTSTNSLLSELEETVRSATLQLSSASSSNRINTNSSSNSNNADTTASSATSPRTGAINSSSSSSSSSSAATNTNLANASVRHSTSIGSYDSNNEDMDDDESLSTSLAVSTSDIVMSNVNITSSINTVTDSSSSSSEGITVEAISGLISGVIDKLNAFKRKATESMADEMDASNSCKRRLEHVKEYALKANSTVPSDIAAVNKWKRKRLDRMLVEHFLRCGYYESAIKLARHSGIEHLTNIELFLVSREVEESLRDHETAKCLSWCHDNRSRLRKLHSTLEFNLRQQEFIELIRSSRFMEAINHARKYLSNCEDRQQEELPRVMGLLLCKPDTLLTRYRDLFDESKWDVLIEQFRQENFKLFQLSSTSVFSVTLQAGLSSLKTPQCYRNDGVKVPDCPVCSELMNTLASSLPCAHCSQSRLVCAISGMPLNEHNQPLMLPNGHVYGSVSLNQMAAQNKGRVTCPRTGQVCSISDAQKVYVM